MDEGAHVTRRRTAGLIAIGALLALPGVAEAKTKQVLMGTPPSSQKAFEKLGVDLNDYFPHGVAVNVGDKVKFVPVGFHTFDFPPKGGSPLPIISPTGDKVAGVNDAANQPFWFNGADQLSFTPALGQGVFGKKLVHNGKKRLESGLPFTDKPKPITITFKKAGKFTYYCNVHAGMKGVVTVKPKGKKVPSARSDKRTVKNQVARSMKTAKGLSKTVPPANTIDVGVAGKHGEEFFGMVPSTLTVASGTLVTFRMSPGSFDVHTATTGPGSPDDKPTYLGQVEEGFNGQIIDPRGAYPSEPPTAGAATLSPALHGNGFWNTGAMDTSADTPLPGSNAVTFGAPGTYTFYCLIHTDMKTTVTVQ
jgi:plastocyanin